MNTNIPTYEEAEKAVEDGEPTALESFVYQYEPEKSVYASEFRNRLQNVLNWVAYVKEYLEGEMLYR